MALNVFIIRRWAAIILGGFIPTLLFTIGNIYYNLMGGIGFFLIGLLLSMLLVTVLLRNPFTQMIEGKGIMVLNIDSTGVITPFLVGVQSPYIRGRFQGKEVNDVFDREAVFNLAGPKLKGGTATPITEGEDQGGILIRLNEEDYNRGRFAMFHYPVLLWNNQIKSIVTKDFLSEMEKTAFAEHGVLYLNRKMEELTSVVRDFGRHVVELLKPKQGLFGNNWVIWLVIGLVVLLLAMFGPAVWQQLSKFTAPAAQAVSTAASANGGLVVPNG